MKTRLAHQAKSVAIVQRLIADYRAPFYLGLETALASRGISLTVFAAAPPAGSGFRDALDLLPFGRRTRVIGSPGRGYWMPILRQLLGYDLVIVEQANSALLNYPLFAARLLARHPGGVAFWGHGATFQAQDSGPLRRALKSATAPLGDHWFGYTEMSRRPLMAAGVKPERITVVNNSVDTADIARVARSLTPAATRAIRNDLGLADGPVCVFCSRLYAGKRLDFLVAALDEARRLAPDLQLLVIGDGPERGWMETSAISRPWIRLAGALYGEAKARALACGDLLLLPASLGLSILDGFAASLPCIVAESDDHGPEIAYLHPEENGLVTPADETAYAHAVANLLMEPHRLARLKDGARATSERYSMARMIANFADGVEKALGRRVEQVVGGGEFVA